MSENSEVVVLKEPITNIEKEVCTLHVFNENLWKRLDSKKEVVSKNAKPFTNAMIKYAEYHNLNYRYILSGTAKKLSKDQFQALVATSVANEEVIFESYKNIIEKSADEATQYFKDFYIKYDAIINDTGDAVKEAEIRKLSQEKIDEIYTDFYKLVKKLLAKDQDQIQSDIEKLLSDLQDYEDKRLQKSLAEQLKKAVNIYKLREQEAELEADLIVMVRRLFNNILSEAIKNQKTFKKESIEVRMEIDNLHFDNKKSQDESWFCILCWKKYYDESEKGRNTKNVDF